MLVRRRQLRLGLSVSHQLYVISHLHCQSVIFHLSILLIFALLTQNRMSGIDDRPYCYYYRTVNTELTADVTVNQGQLLAAHCWDIECAMLTCRRRADWQCCCVCICEQVDAGETSSAETWFTSFTPTVCHITSSLSICHLSSIYTFSICFTLWKRIMRHMWGTGVSRELSTDVLSYAVD